MNTVAIVQARMGSTRLPGKVLLPLRGVPVLDHVLLRLSRCRELDRIVVATTDLPEDDVLEEHVLGRGFEVVRGSASHVLRRYGQAARATRAGIVARVTGDAPLVDPDMLGRWIVALRESGADTVESVPAGRMIHQGVSVFSRRALDWLLRTVPGDPVAREHVDAWFRGHPGVVTCTRCPAEPRHYFRGARLSVDTPADLAFLEAVHAELGAGPGEVDTAELVELLRRRPDLLAINGHVHQKSADEPTRTVLLHCGPGAQARGRALGEALRDAHGIGVTLAVEGDTGQEHDAGQAGLPGVRIEGAPGAALARLCQERRPDAVVLVESDVRPLRLPGILLVGWGAGEDVDLALDAESPDTAAADLLQAFERGSLAA